MLGGVSKENLRFEILTSGWDCGVDKLLGLLGL
jgi:hypothetical protein